MLKTITLNRKTGLIINVKIEESNEKIDYSGLINSLAQKYSKEKCLYSSLK